MSLSRPPFLHPSSALAAGSAELLATASWVRAAAGAAKTQPLPTPGCGLNRTPAGLSAH